MPIGKRKVKKVSIFQSMMKALGYVPAPKKRPGKKVSVKPYVRKSPVKAEQIPATIVTSQGIFTEDIQSVSTEV